MSKVFVAISLICCALIGEIKANAYQNSQQQVYNWQQGRNYAVRSNGKVNYQQSYQNQYVTSTVNPVRNFYNTQATTKPPYAQYVPLITASPYSAQSNYGYAPATLSSSSKAMILKQEYERHPDGGYRFFYETSDGQSREEVGFFREDPRLGKVLTVHGSYGYIAPNKKKIFVKYIADENGYRSQVSNHPPAHLPSNFINQQLGYLKY